ncbi:DUF1214 domain-containing protein [Sphingomonas immobilis]|uniref:DUF1214 domain-containing protein n=1 Tax=Sphingomonas immobilis TaxID=3063997 RepID=A0ABT9A220_9SPHN|nr:DUF1214 domain-containing protein [Sphingomonas sp. CA1-15]MDO7843603.1 DUF1214 domain-containing protein [Sphingomonas sp. CA1-15]
MNKPVLMNSVMGILAAVIATHGVSAEAPVAATPVLATPEQLAAEKTLLKLLVDPDVRAAEAGIVKEFRTTAAAQTPEGSARLASAVEQWTTSLILREIAADPVHPAILWTTDDTPHRWFGYSVPGIGIAGDNPDHIYRSSFVDGGGQYEIRGQIDPAHRPAQFSVEVTRGQPGKLTLARQTRDHPDMGNQIAMLTDQNIKVDADGTFTIAVGGAPKNANYVPLAEGSIALNFRDVLSDWRQKPIALTLRRLDPATPAPRPDSELRQKVIEDLPGYVRFWAGFKDTWLGGIQPNKLVGPVPRDGNWGFLAGGRYDLGPDEVIVLTTTHGVARYTGVQVTDPWMIAADATKYQTSINTSQATPNANGSFTYVIGPKDPGVANWIDTAGFHHGYLLARWQGFPAGASGDGLLKEYRVAKFADVANGRLAGVAKAAASERRKQLSLRASGYANRTR